MKKFDAWLIERHERFGHWFQRLTGLTNFWLAKAAFMLFAICPLGHIGPLVWARDSSLTPFVVMFLFMSYIAFTTRKRICKASDLLEAYYAEGSHTAHPGTLLVREYWQLRIMMIGALSMLGIMQVTLYVSLSASLNMPTALVIFSLVLVNFWWGAIISVYFLACIPLPPGKSKVQSWLESFQATPELKEVEVPVR